VCPGSATKFLRIGGVAAAGFGLRAAGEKDEGRETREDRDIYKRVPRRGRVLKLLKE